MRNKVVDAAEAVAIICSGDTVASSGFVGVGTPDEIIKALERRFIQTGEPRDLSLVFAAAPGDGADRGLNLCLPAAHHVRYTVNDDLRRIHAPSPHCGRVGFLSPCIRFAGQRVLPAEHIPVGDRQTERQKL